MACYHCTLCCSGRNLFGQNIGGERFLSKFTTPLTVTATLNGIAPLCVMFRSDAGMNGVGVCGGLPNGV
jgi:hypothetical protein